MSVPVLSPTEVEWLHRMVDLARTGQTESLASAIDAGLPANLTTGSGDSLLILAAYHGHADTVHMLLVHNADTERVNDRGQTALAAATFRQDQLIISLLLSAGADPTTGQRSALHIADYFNLTDIKSLLIAPVPGTPF